MKVALLLFEGITALDVVGPYEALGRVPDFEVTFVAKAPGPCRTGDGKLALVADAALADVPSPDILVIPGGPGTRALMKDEELLAWLRAAHEKSRWTTSVCTGALLLAAAGILDGIDAATHWRAREDLAALGVNPVPERVVRYGKIVTAAGVSSGIDMALQLIAWEKGDDLAKAVQLAMEYDPQPPFASGNAESAEERIRELAASLVRMGKK